MAIAAEALTLIPAVLDSIRISWNYGLMRVWDGEMVEGLLLLHIYLLMPILLAVSTGYFVSSCIRYKVPPSAN